MAAGATAWLLVCSDGAPRLAHAQTDQCAGVHCYADRQRVYNDTTVISVSGSIEYHEAEVADGISTIAVWLKQPNANKWLEFGLLRGDGEDPPCRDCEPYPSSTTLYSYCEGCGFLTQDRKWGNYGPATEYRTQFRIRRVAMGELDDTWVWELCPGGGCTNGSDSGWQEVRRELVPTGVSSQLSQLNAGGETSSDENVIGVSGILGLHRTLSGNCGGQGQPCDADWVSYQTAYHVLHGPPPDPRKYHSVWVPGSPTILQMFTTCHIDGNGCP
jgi:hypothetical protein